MPDRYRSEQACPHGEAGSDGWIERGCKDVTRQEINLIGGGR